MTRPVTSPPADSAATDQPERRGLLILMFATLGLLAPLAVWARLVVPEAWDVELLAALHIPDAGPVRLVVESINTLGNLLPWALLVLALAIVAGIGRFFQAAVLIALSLVSDLASFGVKLLVECDRPESALVEQLVGTDSFAFPSGHVVRATALVAVLAWVLIRPGLRLPLAVVAGVLGGLLMGYARVALGVHWPTDALGGVLLGLGWFALSAALVGQAGQRQRAAS